MIRLNHTLLSSQNGRWSGQSTLGCNVNVETRISAFALSRLIGVLMIFCAALFWTCTAASAGARNALGETALEAINSVVRVDIVRLSPGGQSGQLAYRTLCGSGFIFDTDSHIVTAAHLLEGSVQISIVTASGNRHTAQEVGRDQLSDVAVLKVAAKLPPPLSISTTLPETLTDIVALGSPFGLDTSMSFGQIISSDRAISTTDANVYLQHDAAINPGSSGGPILDKNGKVLGLNLSLPKGQFSFSGIAFALEGRVLHRVANEIIDFGIVDRGRLGATMRDAATLGWRLGVNSSLQGVIVIDVAADGAADNAGISTGDVIVSANGRPIHSLSQLLNFLDDSRAGNRVTLGVKSDIISPVRRKEVLLQTAKTEMTQIESYIPEHGLTLSDQPEISILAVAPNSLADVSGLRAGDRIIAVNLTKVVSLAQAEAIVDIAPAISLLIIRGKTGARLVVLGENPAEAGIPGANSLGRHAAIR